MKGIITVLCIFVITMATSCLFDLEFVSRNWVRQILVGMLILFELFFGYQILRQFFSNSKAQR